MIVPSTASVSVSYIVLLSSESSVFACVDACVEVSAPGISFISHDKRDSAIKRERVQVIAFIVHFAFICVLLSLL